MSPLSRLPRLAALVAVLAFLGPAPAAPRKEDPKASNLKGRIEGTKWSSIEQTVKGQKLPAGILKLEFTKDGKLTYDVGPMALTGTYELKAGDEVVLRFEKELDGRKEHTQTVRIKDGRLFLIDSDGTTGEFEPVK
jgi:hypothetical protein